MNDDEEHDPEAAIERFEEFARKVFSKTKDDLKKVEQRAAGDR
jgi:hypothetical protein